MEAGLISAYLRHSGRPLAAVIVIFIVAISLPAFSLFADRDAGMLQLHLLMELFAVIVSILIATVSWYSFNRAQPNESSLLVAGFFAVAVIDLVHALSFDGMPRLVTENSTPKAIFFWLAGRTLVVAILLMVALNIQQRLRRSLCLAAAAVLVVIVFWIGVFDLELLPLTYVKGVGVTPFKTAFEFGLFAANIVVAALFIFRSTAENRDRSFEFATACLIMGIGELVFAHYRAPSDFLNFFGHVFKVIAYLYLFRLAIVDGIRKPYQDSRRAEAELAHLNNELEQRVQQRTRELEGANKELGEYSYVVSHDLKAPLRGIASLVGWIEQDYRDRLDPAGIDMLRLLGQRSHRMHRLIEDILEYSRIGRVPEARSEVDLGRLVADIVDAIEVPANIRIHIDGPLPTLRIEASRLQQVFQNLLSNAVKHMGPPGGEVVVSCLRAPDCWRFCVADNGPGIDARHHQSIFAIFQTVNKQEGMDSTGVGLSIVKKIVEAYNGKVWVESEPGAGAKFFFTLPLAEKSRI